jgi:hypothetical protein
MKTKARIPNRWLDGGHLDCLAWHRFPTLVVTVILPTPENIPDMAPFLSLKQVIWAVLSSL